LYDIPRLLHAISGILETLGDGDFTPEAIQTRLDNVFDAICAEYPGAVTTRHSYGLFKKLGHIDREEMQAIFVQDTTHLLEAAPGAHPVTLPTGQVGQRLLLTQQQQHPVYEAGHALRYHGELDTEKWSRLYANARIPANQSVPTTVSTQISVMRDSERDSNTEAVITPLINPDFPSFSKTSGRVSNHSNYLRPLHVASMVSLSSV
jgi:hypothetical protein